MLLDIKKRESTKKKILSGFAEMALSQLLFMDMERRVRTPVTIEGREVFQSYLRKIPERGASSTTIFTLKGETWKRDKSHR